MVIVSPEIAGLAASLVGVLGLILRKARFFIRRVNNSWEGGVGFCDAIIVPSSEMNGTIKQSWIRRFSRSYPDPIELSQS